MVSFGDATLQVDAGALPVNVHVTLALDADGEQVELAENETPVSGVFTLTQDQDVTIDTSETPFRMTLPFDAAAVGTATPSEAEVFVKMATADDVFSLLGTIADGQVEILLFALPPHASFQVVYNPNCVILLDTDETSRKGLPAPTPWETTRWGVHFDITAAQLRTVLGAILNKDPSAVTRDEAKQVIRDRVLRPARDIGVAYQNMGFWQPRLEIRTRDDGKKRFILHLVRGDSRYMTWGDQSQIHITYSTVGWDTSHQVGSCKGIIAHELFHAVIRSYRISRAPTDDQVDPYDGFNEGMATVMGHTMDYDGAVHVRPDGVARSYTLMLSQPLGVMEPREAKYTNQDFFAYAGKRFGGGTMTYLAGTDMDGDVRNGVLEQMRKYVVNHPELVAQGAPSASYLKAYRIGLHNSCALQFAASLADVYWDFARNRAYENNAESCLRPADSDVQWILHAERFDAGAVYQHTFHSDTETAELSYETVPALKSIQPFSTRALVFNGSGFKAKLTLSFETFNWLGDELGNSMRVKVYKTGYDGAELTADNSTITLDGFGADFEQVLVVLSNVDTEGSYSIIMTATTEPSSTQSGPCAPNGTPEDPWNRWYIQTDPDCDQTWDNGYWYLFEDGGVVSDPWLGVLESLSWRVEGNKMIITGRYSTMEATFSQDCQRLENGVSVGGNTEFCWEGEKN